MRAPALDDGDVRVYHGDCVEVMREMDPASVDAIVCDPPYGLEFMGKEWDAPWREGGETRGETTSERAALAREYATANPGAPRYGWSHGAGAKTFDARAFQAWCETWAVEALRVLKPGGHLLAFGGTRTFHRLTCAIEDAGFEVRDCLSWLYGSGFPKSRDVSKAIDAEAGAERERVPYSGGIASGQGNYGGGGRVHFGTKNGDAPATPEAARWQGWGTALKPAWEPCVLARKPLAERTVAAQVLATGTGAVNVDGCRIEANGERFGGGANGSSGFVDGYQRGSGFVESFAGRWPANVALDEGWEPVLRLRYNLSEDARALLEGWIRASGVDLRAMRGHVRRPAEPGEAPALLRAPVPSQVDVREPEGRGSPDAWAETPARVAGEDGREGAAEREAWAGEPRMEGLVHLSGLPDDLATGRPGGPGASSRNGRGAGAAAQGRRGRPPHQRRQDGQPAGEPGAARQADAQDDARGPLPGAAGVQGGGVEVLMRSVPREWLRFFDFSGDVVRVGAAAMLDAEVGDKGGGFGGNTGRPAGVYGEYAGLGGGTIGYGDTGGPSRFFYTAKAGAAEREGSKHPTVKPVALMRWLVRLVTPPGGLVLDPFAGSGTTLRAARDEGFRAVGIEREGEYLEDIAHRLRQLSLFGEAG